MDTIAYFREQFEQIQANSTKNELTSARLNAFNAFSRLGIPTTRNEEWKYTRISGMFNKAFQLATPENSATLTAADIDAVRLPGFDAANQLVFVNGIYAAELSSILSQELKVISLDEAAGNEYRDIVASHFNHSSNYLKDGINALNAAFLQGGIFIHVAKGKVITHPVYIYNITDAREQAVLAQPRSLFYISERAEIQIAETYATLGASDSFTNQVMEVVVERDANVAYYKIQNDAAQASQVSTTHIRQIGKSYVHTVTVSLDGGVIRNNLNIVMEAADTEAHLYGLYFQRGQSHIDNHTVVDNVATGCQSNELYKGILDDHSTGVFNGKVFVRQPAQKTNAFQSNKNILLSDNAGINTKPQLEIFADDVKCSHGCTVGQLDEEGLFYLQSRGIPEKAARALLLQGFAIDILDKIKLTPIRDYVDQLIAARLEFERL